MYDVSKYTDAELFRLMDLDSPTDRELEMKIHMLIEKYGDMDATDMVAFFTNVYDHFFESPQREEGFETGSGPGSLGPTLGPGPELDVVAFYDSLKAFYRNQHEQKTSLSRYGYERDDALFQTIMNKRTIIKRPICLVLSDTNDINIITYNAAEGTY